MGYTKKGYILLFASFVIFALVAAVFVVSYLKDTVVPDTLKLLMGFATFFGGILLASAKRVA